MLSQRPVCGIDPEGRLLQPCQEVRVGARDRRLGLAPGIGEEAQPAAGGDPAVELAQRAGGGVARVHEGRLALASRAGALSAGKSCALHIDFAAHLEHCGLLAVEALRDVADGAHVGGDVLAD